MSRSADCGKCVQRVDPQHIKYGVFAVKHPETGKILFFLSRALPFGVKASVHGFNRASRALNVLVHEYAGVTTGTHVDDYPMVAPQQVAKSMSLRMKQLMTVLGWPLKRKSLRAPANTFTHLGVVFKFDSSPMIVVANKEERISSIRDTWKKLKEAKTATGQEIAALRGLTQARTLVLVLQP